MPGRGEQMMFDAMKRVIRKYSSAAGGREQGFTLMEVLVAVTILGLAYMVVLQNFSMSLKNIGRLETAGFRRFNQLLEAEKQFLAPVEREEQEEIEGLEYIKGRRYKLVEVEDESGDIVTLLLQRL